MSRRAPGRAGGSGWVASRQPRSPVCVDAPLGLVLAQRRAELRRGRRNCHLGGDRKTRRGARRSSDRSIARRSPLTAFVLTFSLIVQLFAAATPPALAAPAFAGADDAAIAAELKAVFGDAAQLCVQINDDKALRQACAVRPLLRSMPALPLRRSGRGVCRAGPAGLAGAARQRSACDPRAARPGRSSRISRPAKPRPSASPRSLTVVRRARPPARVRIPSDLRTSFHVYLPNPLGRGRAARPQPRPVAHARLPSRCLRRPYLPGHPRDRRSRRHDELTLPTVSYVPFNSDGAHEWDASFSWTKTITPGLSVVIGSGPTWEHPGGYGWNALDTELQWQALCIPDAEFMFKVGFDISWAGTGTGILAGSGGQNTYSPLVDFGLGFGTLPQSVKYLRPFAITGEFSTTAPGQDWTAASRMSRRSTGGSPSNTACRTSTRIWLRSTTTSSSI